MVVGECALLDDLEKSINNVFATSHQLLGKSSSHDMVYTSPATRYKTVTPTRKFLAQCFGAPENRIWKVQIPRSRNQDPLSLLSRHRQ